MERSQVPLPQKSSSFSIARDDVCNKLLKEADRNFSLGSIRFEEATAAAAARHERKSSLDDLVEEEEDDDADNGDDVEKKRTQVTEEDCDEASELRGASDASATGEDSVSIATFVVISEEVDYYIGILRSITDGDDERPDIPTAVIERFATLFEKEIAKCESGEARWWSGHGAEGENSVFLDAVNRACKLSSAIVTFSSPEHPKHASAINLTGGAIHRAMTFLEDEFFSLLVDEARPLRQDGSRSSKTTRKPLSFSHGGSGHEVDHYSLQHSPSASGEQSNNNSAVDQQLEVAASAVVASPAPYQPETVELLRKIASAMTGAGYATECTQVFAVARWNAVDASISELGFEKVSIDETLRMPWEPLEASINSWIKAFRHLFSVGFQQERELCESVFPATADAPPLAVFGDMARVAVTQMLGFAEAVAMTKRSAEKLFKVLDMYEALHDAISKSRSLIGASVASAEEHDAGGASEPMMAELKMELCLAKSRLGEAAIEIFNDLGNSINADAAKTPVPGGAVHPLTSYVMNYLKYACEYKNTLQQVFLEHSKSESPSSYDEADQLAAGGDESSGDQGSGRAASRDTNPFATNNPHHHQQSDTGGGGEESAPFAAELTEVMDLLHSNLEAKAKLYKDPALSSIFLMNNGRYISQKIKGAAEVSELLGDGWVRRRSSSLRQYHKNYQRETWGKVLGCLKDEGLSVNGKVAKPVLKERFKSFTAMFEEIHKAQSGWVVRDEQLQSELRVSVSAVVVPAYRSFLGRFQHHLSPGRQTEKYIKFAPEDLETYIDELFDGNPASMARKRT